MTTVHGLQRRHAELIGIALFCLTSSLVTRSADSVKSADDAYLDALQGKWVVEGTLGGKPVRNFADGQRVLHGGFLKLHLIDVGSPSQHEADV
jgi:hypothetical protein